MIRCPRCARLVVDTDYVHRCPGCGASLLVTSDDPAALKAEERRLWWDLRLTGKGARRAFRSGVTAGLVLGGLAHLLGSQGANPWWSAGVALIGGALGGLIAFLRLGHLSGMVVYGMGLVIFSGLFNPFAWIQFIAAGAVIAFIVQDRRQGI